VNWTRALNRIYIVLALCWVAYVLVVSPMLSYRAAQEYAYAQKSVCRESIPYNVVTETEQFRVENKKCDDIYNLSYARNSASWPRGELRLP
jgi:hypothetical protein